MNYSGNRKSVDYSNSSNGYDKYMEKLNRQHPTKEDPFNNGYNYGMDRSVSSMHRQLNAQVHKELDNVRKEQKKKMEDIKQAQRNIRKGYPTSFIQ